MLLKGWGVLTVLLGMYVFFTTDADQGQARGFVLQKVPPHPPSPEIHFHEKSPKSFVMTGKI
jgi:hypothetical protein